jgi:hypothetical protein
MTARQRKLVTQIWEQMFLDRRSAVTNTPIPADEPFYIRHGGASGADEEFHAIISQHPVHAVDVWPSDLPRWRMKEIPQGRIVNLVIHQVSPPLQRNWTILENANLLLACPDSPREVIRSGTWSTIRRADKLDIKAVVVAPWDTNPVQ